MSHPTQIAILGAGIFVRTEYIPKLAEISHLFTLKAIWSRTEVYVTLPTVVSFQIHCLVSVDYDVCAHFNFWVWLYFELLPKAAIFTCFILSNYESVDQW